MVAVHAILQARMSSSRLPGKVLADIHGAPMIIRQLERISLATRVDRVTVAISNEQSDDRLFEVLSDFGADVRRGSLTDVASRFYDVIQNDSPQSVVRLTADCPLCDWDVIDLVIEEHERSTADYTSNTLNRTFPKRLDVEVFNAETFCELFRQGFDSFESEHVTPALYSQNSDTLVQSVEKASDSSRLRWTVDYPGDLEFVRYVYSKLYTPGLPFRSSLIPFLERASSLEPE